MIKRKLALFILSIALCLTLSSCSLVEIGTELITDFISNQSRQSFISKAEKIGPKSDNEFDGTAYSIKQNGHEAVSKDKYYGYSKLEGDQKKAYDLIDEAVYELKTTISLVNLDINDDEFNKVFTHYLNDNPQVFWLYDEYTFLYSNTNNPADAIALLYTDGEIVDEVDLENYCLSKEASRAAISQQIKEVSSAVSDAIKSIPVSESDRNKAKLLHEYLCGKISYDYETAEKISEFNEKLMSEGDAERDYNIKVATVYGALIENSAVCSGISESYQFLLYCVGIENLTCFGISEGEHHQWNIVLLGDNYYHVDVTWDLNDGADDETSLPSYEFLFMNDDMIKETHTEEIYKNTITDYKYCYEYPECKDGSLYFHSKLIATIPRHMSASKITPCIETAVENGVKYVEVHYSNISERELPYMVGEWCGVIDAQRVLTKVGNKFGKRITINDTYIYNLNSKIVYLLLEY